MEFKLTEEQYEIMKKEILSRHFNYENELIKLKNYLGKQLYQGLKSNNAIIAGGMITSLFTKSKINDVDIYFRNDLDVFNFANEYLDGNFIYAHTPKATQFAYNDKIVQIIHYKTFESVEDIFSSFDYTVCMGAFDFKTEEFILHPEFLKHNSQKVLKFSGNTDFPIISLLRIQKYEGKGYSISKPDFLKLVLRCMTLEINTYEDLMNHLGGMYGETYESVFKDCEDDEFSLEKAIEKLSDIKLKDDYYLEYHSCEYSYDNIIEYLDKSEKVGVLFKDRYYRIINGEMDNVIDMDKLDKIITLEEYYKDKKFYKYVHKDTNGKYTSFYNNKFEYIIGEEIKAEEEYDGSGNNGLLFFNKKDKLHHSPYKNRENRVIIEVSVNAEDVIGDEYTELRATKCKVLREVPISISNSEMEDDLDWI